MMSVLRVSIDKGHILLAASIIVALMSLGVATAAVFKPALEPSSIAFSENVYEPLNHHVCPGDPLVYGVQMSSSETSVALATIMVYDVNARETVTEGSSSKYIYLPEDASSNPITITYPTPDLPPSKYVLVSSFSVSGDEDVHYLVPFQVDNECYE